MKRRDFVQKSAMLSAGLITSKISLAVPDDFPVVRRTADKRNFKSKAVEAAIAELKTNVKNRELTWLFENCFPNTLDTTVFYDEKNGHPDTYIITGDIDAMWMRDSSAQVWPYLQFISKDQELRKLIAGVIYRQTGYILKDAYANAFYKDENKVSEWKNDKTDMKPGVHERKWELDSLCYPIRLAYHYWKESKDTSPFNERWMQGIKRTLEVMTEQQRKHNKGSYHFQRSSIYPQDTQSMHGYGFPVKPVGLVCSSFRPSDDATTFPFLIPSNFFAVVSLKQAAEMVLAISRDAALAQQLNKLAAEIEEALKQYAVVEHPQHGRIYAFEVDGFGSRYIMDDSNVPNLLSMPYLGSVNHTDPVYQNTRKFILSTDNPYFFKGTAAEGVGGPHVGPDMIWPMSIIMRGLTSTSDQEIKSCIATLLKTHADKGFMHESFNKDDPNNFTRSWFAWANTLFGEFIWKVYQQKRYLLT